MYWRRFAISDIPLEDQKSFESWLLARWAEKDELLETYFDTGRFPSDLEGSVSIDGTTPDRKSAAGQGYIEADIRLGHWIEILQMFVVLGGLAFVLRYIGVC